VEDWDDDGIEEENDRVPFTISQEIVESLGEGESIRLTLEGDVDDIRVWLNGSVRLGDGADEVGEINPANALEFEVEFSDFLVEGTLYLDKLDSEGAILESASVTLIASPMIFNHHLQNAEQVYAVSVSGIYGNSEFISGYTDALGDRFTSLRGSDYGNDVWLQDEIEYGYMAGANGQHVDVIFDTIRDRGLDDFAEDYHDEPDFPIMTWGKGNASGQDYGGNLEISPPVTVDGVTYPVGRFYYGDGGNRFLKPNEDVIEMLETMKIQKPFTLDISFLCVGHVDEFTSFVPDSTSEKGFRLVVGDALVGLEWLDTVDPDMQIPQYRGAPHNVNTVGQIQEDQALRALQEELQEDFIEPAVEIMKAELGLTEDDIIRLPALYEEPGGGCGTTTAALIPGTVNLIVANFVDETPMIFTADPFFRGSNDTQDDDIFIAEIERLLPAELDIHWLDDWNAYHAALGEVHCGSNVVRTPPELDWTQSLGLLGEDK
jgi:protein-arginine deiminase